MLAVRGIDAQSPADCTVDSECGSNSTCRLLQCTCSSSSFSISGSNTDCRDLTDPDPRCSKYDENCVYCGRLYEGPCQRCSVLIHSQDSTCTDTCEDGDIEITLLPMIGRSARICITLTSFPLWGIIVIIAVAAAVLIILFVGLVGLLCYLQRPSRGQFDIEMTTTETPGGTMRTKRSNSFSFSFQSKKQDADASLIHENHLYIDDNDDFGGDDEVMFKSKLVQLRKEADVFLKMLNDMRRRARELPPDSPVAEQYKNVMRDVTRVLYLLNKKPSKVQMPVDGIQLVKWSENILKRYTASQDKEKSMEKDAVPSYMEGSSQQTGVFMEKLEYLRDYAETFLRMLNEMRRRLKELRPDTPTAQNYRVISKDVTRLLDMLNKRPSSVEMPFDGMELVNKSERLLKNYLESQGIVVEYKKAERLSAFGAQDETDF